MDRSRVVSFLTKSGLRFTNFLYDRDPPGCTAGRRDQHMEGHRPDQDKRGKRQRYRQRGSKVQSACPLESFEVQFGSQHQHHVTLLKHIFRVGQFVDNLFAVIALSLDEQKVDTTSFPEV